MVSHLFERQRELHERCSLKVDPFVLLKEVSEMSRLYKDSCANQDTSKDEMTRAEYNAYTAQAYENLKGQNRGLPGSGFDPSELEEKMKKLRFVNPNAGAPKDSNWHTKVGALVAGKSPERDLKESSRHTQTNWTKKLLTKEDEIEIAKSMIPQFIQRQKELQP